MFPMEMYGEGKESIGHFMLPLSKIKAAKDWKIDGEYVVELRVRQNMLSRSDVAFDIVSVLSAEECDKKEVEDEE